MRFFATLTAASSLLASVSAVGVRICYNSPFQDCTTVTGGSGQCIYVGAPYNDHVFSANALSDTSYCDSYTDINNGACSGPLVGGIDQSGYSGLPYGSDTSGFVCYA
ncbi:hypothetical protein VE04_07813 [Pseudogymnoascus sp. 24MN13]|nr:hypothetical protein VE04_07813 [Pseudogymnoascus sp. 24MN13]